MFGFDSGPAASPGVHTRARDGFRSTGVPTSVWLMAYLVEKIAESFKDFGVTRNYGTPVTVSGVEIVPVSLVWLGYGAGNDQDENGGGGGGGGSIPIGAYVYGADGVRFRPNLIALMAMSIPLACIAGRALPRIIKALKK